VGLTHECRLKIIEQVIKNLKFEGGVRKNMSSAYCVKCKAKREVSNPEQVTMKNGRKALKGTCPNCGTKMFKIGG
jgi:RNase P subunit RPR2